MGEGIGFVSEPAGLDFGAVMAIAAGRGADLELLAEILPPAEARIIAAMTDRGDPDGE